MAQAGRPRAFDRDQAVDKAMLLFWRHGFDATSLNQLKSELGISSASFYAAFASKEALFREAVDRYLDSFGRASSPLWDTTLSARRGLETALRNSARMQTDQAHPAGCLLVIAVMTSSVDSEHLQDLMRQARGHIRDGVVSCLTRAKAAGELASGSNIVTLATVFETFLFGLSTEARDGVPIAVLERSITTMMDLLQSP